MIDYHSSLVTTLSLILPTYYEMNISRELCEIPCISYMESNNSDYLTGDTLGYSNIQYLIKVWGTNIEDLQGYSQSIDSALKEKGFKRVSSVEIYDANSSMIQKVLTYEAIGKELFGG